MHVPVRAIALTLALAPIAVAAQRGRAIVSIEALVGSAEAVYVGRVTKVDPESPDLDKPVYDRVTHIIFKVLETIRGTALASVTLPYHSYAAVFQALRDRKTEILIAFSRGYRGWDTLSGFNPVPSSETSRHVYVHALAPVPGADRLQDPAGDFNVASDYGRMFGTDLTVLNRRDAILRRARAFQQRFPDPVGTVEMGLPRGFFELVGYANAYGSVSLAKTADTERALRSLVSDPSRFLKRYKPRNRAEDRNQFVVEGMMALSAFPTEETRRLIEKISKDYKGDPGAPKEGGFSDQRVRDQAKRVLAGWEQKGSR